MELQTWQGLRRMEGKRERAERSKKAGWSHGLPLCVLQHCCKAKRANGAGITGKGAAGGALHCTTSFVLMRGRSLHAQGGRHAALPAAFRTELTRPQSPAQTRGNSGASAAQTGALLPSARLAAPSGALADCRDPHIVPSVRPSAGRHGGCGKMQCWRPLGSNPPRFSHGSRFGLLSWSWM